MRRFALAIVVANLFLTGTAGAESREEYRRCVLEELEGGQPLASIGDSCLKRALLARDSELATEPEVHDEEPYPYEESLRKHFVQDGVLLDPSSVQLKDVVYSDRQNAWCGQLNAKNRQGGYVGWRYFALRDRYRGYGTPSAKDVQFSLETYDPEGLTKSGVEKTCKAYGAWEYRNWQ